MSDNNKDLFIIKSYGQLTETQKMMICTLFAKGEIAPDIHDILIRELRISIPYHLVEMVKTKNPGKIKRLVDFELMTMELNSDMLAARGDLLLKKMLLRSQRDFDRRLDADAEYDAGDITQDDYMRTLDSLYILPVNDIKNIALYFSKQKGRVEQVKIQKKKPAPVDVTDIPAGEEASKPLSVEQLMEISRAVKSGRAVELQRMVNPSAPAQPRYGDPIPEELEQNLSISK